MNILIEELPYAVEIDGREYPIATDFRDCLLVILAFEDPDLTDTEKMVVLLGTMYKAPPHDLKQAAELAVKFLNGGEVADSEDGPASSGRLYSFSQDANLIFSAFQQTHHIDLQTVKTLHWWKFLALFMDLGQHSSFCQLIGLRERIKSGKATKEERAAGRKMKAMLDDRTPEEKEAQDEFLRQVEEGRKNRGEL